MKILALTTSYPTHHEDIRGRFVREWALSIQSLGAELSVLGPQMHPQPSEVDYTGYAFSKKLLMSDGAPDYLDTRPISGAIQGAFVTTQMTRYARQLQFPKGRTRNKQIRRDLQLAVRVADDTPHRVVQGLVIQVITL